MARFAVHCRWRLLVLASVCLCPMRTLADIPRILSIAGETVTVATGPGGKPLEIGATAENWTLMAVLPATDGAPAAVFEDFSDRRGRLVVADARHTLADLPKSLAPSLAESSTGLYRGHTLDEVLNSDRDLLGGEILAQPGDPRFGDVAACLPPIARMFTYTFVGTREGFDKIGFAYGGRSPNFDPAVLVPRIREITAKFGVEDGLVGGWLPVVRFVYPESSGTWTEMLAFAAPRFVNGNRWSQPTWYRVARVEDGRLRWARYFDSFLPFPPRTEAPAAKFYADLLALKQAWETALAGSMAIEVPDNRLADMARHSLVRAMMTRIGSEPKYGVLDRNYGGTEHDGFPDTFNTDTGTLCDWGLRGLAGDYLDNFFGRFVTDDGALLYRGPETGQFGRMLTVVAQFVEKGGDAELALRHRGRIDAVARLLLALRREACTLPPDSPAYGMISGWSEADSSINPEPERYMQPYFGNSAEAARGFHDLGRAWERLGRERRDDSLAEWGRTLQREGSALEHDLQQSISRSRLTSTDPVCLPAIAGVREPFHVAVARDELDPQHRSYRSYMEMLFSGELDREEVGEVLHYRAAHRDLILGLPTAYGYNSHEPAGFLSYGHAYGLLQHDYSREFLLTLYSLMAHQYTRGTWTAPETRSLNAGADAAPYCVPAQLVVPMLAAWMLAFEDPRSETLWLAKGTPREWLADGKVISASAVPTRWGRVAFTLHSHLAAGEVEAELDLPATPFAAAVNVRFRLPGGNRIAGATLDGKKLTTPDPAGETVALPAGLAGHHRLVVNCPR